MGYPEFGREDTCILPKARFKKSVNVKGRQGKAEIYGAKGEKVKCPKAPKSG